MNVRDYRGLTWTLYSMGVLLMAGAISEPLVQILPPRFGDVTWRFGAAGLLSNALIGFLFAVVWLMGTALLAGHRTVLRTLAVVSLVCMAGLLLAGALFTLDFLQVRGSVDPSIRTNLDVIVIRALFIIGLAIPTTLAFGMAGWRAGKATRQSTTAGDGKGGLVYRT